MVKPTAAAIEALVRAIEAKEAAAGDPGPPADPVTPSARTKARATSAVAAKAAATSAGTWSLPPLPVALTPVSSSARGPIPGVMDRQQWEGLITHEAQRQGRHGQATAVVLAELDGLDELVARMGPAAVNRLIPPCAGILVAVARASDRIARLATGRFGILLLQTDDAGAARYAARATAAVDTWLTASPWHVRLSIGWAATTDPDELRRGLRNAEAHLRARRA